MGLQTSFQPLAHYMNAYSLVIQKELSRLVSIQTEPYQVVFEAVSYSLLNGGKRLRPLLVIATTEALGGDPEQAILPACTLEMIHTYSMIHDDLPCMDNDDYRRGNPTLHKVHDEAIALLAGDLLLTYSFELLANAPHLQETQRLELIRVLAKASGGHGMIGGQVMDMTQHKTQATLKSLQKMHAKKTGALLIAALEFGAIIAQANNQVRAQLQQFGAAIGLAYQIVDDILDVIASEQKHGRQAGSDHLNGKETYVTFLGLEGAKDEADRLLLQAKECIASLDLENERLQELADLIVQRTI